MDEDVLNQQVRKFLKKVGINSQREIERAVHEAVAAGRWPSEDPVNARMQLSIPELGVELVIADKIALC
jgi:Family of unknown function (DUF6494)